MKKISLILALLMVFTFAFTGCGTQAEEESPSVAEGPTDEAVEVNISAAASMTDALNEIKEAYAKESNAILLFNYAASGTLRKQIEEGAPCDLFISASASHMDTLEQEGLIVSDTRKDLLKNTLTLVASTEKADQIKSYEDMGTDAIASVSIGTPDSVPAGKYAQQALQNLGLWDKLESADKIVYAKDVRQVLEYVDTGNVDCGLVYSSDTVVMDTGVVIMDMPEDSHAPIVYPAALTKDSAQSAAAAKFYEFLKTDTAAEIFEKYGFSMV